MITVETKIKQSRKQCPSCKKEMYYIEVGKREEGKTRFNWKRFYSTWSSEYATQYTPHNVKACEKQVILEEREKTFKFEEFNYRIVEPNCLSCVHHETSDSGFYCTNPKLEDTSIGGFHSLEYLVNGDGTLELFICKDFLVIP